MKEFNLLISLTLVLSFMACEKIVEPDLETSNTKLVVDARVNLFKNQPSNVQQVKLSLSKPFYQDQINSATGAVVIVTDGNGGQFNYTETGTTGVYEHHNFTPVIGETYTLNIEYAGETYSAQELLRPIPEPDSIYITNRPFADDEENLTLTLAVKEPAGLGDHYLWEAYWPNKPDTTVTLQIEDDEFVDGNYLDDFPLFWGDLDLEVDDVIEVQMTAISPEAFDYYFLLLENIYNGGSDTVPATPASNVVNITNPNNKALGYFKVGEVVTETVTVYRP